MRAIVYEREARKAGLAEMPAQRPSSSSEVLFQPGLAAICGSDLHMFHGSPAYGWVLPRLILGHEGVGTVAGEEGAFVVNPYLPCGACTMCRRGETSTCMGPAGGRGKESAPWSLQYGFRRHGTMGEAIAVERGSLVPVPDGLAPELAALSEGAAVSWHGIEVGAQHLLGAGLETAVVLGPGPVGASATLFLGARGVKVAVLGLPRDGERLRRTERLGAAAAVSDGKALEETVDAWTDRAGVDLVIEATGSEAAWATALSVVRRGGAVVGLGIPGQALSLEVRKLVRGGVGVCGAYGVRRSDLERTLGFLHAHQERALALFDCTFPLGRGGEAFEYAAGSSGKVLLDVRR